MELWKWLTTNPVAFGAVIGAGGSVVAQIIAAVVGAITSIRRANSERRDRALDRAAAERERFDASRREVFEPRLYIVKRTRFSVADSG
jgi:hypothetical protein